LSFDLDPLGPLHIQASLQDGCISIQLWAQKTATAEFIDHELKHLRDRLLAIGLTVKDLTCHQGTPPQGAKTALQQRWIDDLA
jgi:flagellar hook-length control protein FliK